MEKNKIITLIAIFFTLGLFIISLNNTHLEKPFSGDQELISPYNRINEKDLEIDNNRLIINIPGIKIASYSNTNSMDPVIDEHSIGLEIVPESEDDIHIGDIVAYQSGNNLIVHRVTFINEDEKGWYVILKGDNSKEADSEKVRFDDIRYLLIGILY